MRERILGLSEQSFHFPPAGSREKSAAVIIDVLVLVVIIVVVTNHSFRQCRSFRIYSKAGTLRIFLKFSTLTFPDLLLLSSLELTLMFVMRFATVLAVMSIMLT